MNKAIILQARLASSRLPKKVLAELSGKPVIAHIIDRLKTSKKADNLCVAIPVDATEDPLAETVEKLGVTLVRGSGPDVLGRFIQAAYQTQADVIVRTTADNLLVSPEEIDRQLDIITAEPDIDYIITDGYPLGVTPETFTLKTLEKLDYLARHMNDREHVTLYLRNHPGPFSVRTLKAPKELTRPDISLTLDTQQDYKLMTGIFDKLYTEGRQLDLGEVLELLKSEPALASLGRLTVAKATA